MSCELCAGEAAQLAQGQTNPQPRYVDASFLLLVARNLLVKPMCTCRQQTTSQQEEGAAVPVVHSTHRPNLQLVRVGLFSPTEEVSLKGTKAGNNRGQNKMFFFKLGAIALSSAPAAVNGFAFNVAASRATSYVLPTAPTTAFVSAMPLSSYFSQQPYRSREQQTRAAAAGAAGASWQMMAATTTTTVTTGDAPAHHHQQADQSAASGWRMRRTAGMKVRRVASKFPSCGAMLDRLLHYLSPVPVPLSLALSPSISVKFVVILLVYYFSKYMI